MLKYVPLQAFIGTAVTGVTDMTTAQAGDREKPLCTGQRAARCSPTFSVLIFYKMGHQLIVSHVGAV